MTPIPPHNGSESPVAWRWREKGTSLWSTGVDRPPFGADGLPEDGYEFNPLYATPPAASAPAEVMEVLQAVQQQFKMHGDGLPDGFDNRVFGWIDDAINAQITSPAAGREDLAPVEDAWLIVKRDLYFMPDAKGYTGIRDHAGRYTLADAKGWESHAHGTSIVRLADAPEFTAACFDDLARRHVTEQRDALRAQVAADKAEIARLVNWSASQAKEIARLTDLAHDLDHDLRPVLWREKYFETNEEYKHEWSRAESAERDKAALMEAVKPFHDWVAMMEIKGKPHRFEHWSDELIVTADDVPLGAWRAAATAYRAAALATAKGEQ